VFILCGILTIMHDSFFLADGKGVLDAQAEGKRARQFSYLQQILYSLL
jgi:hypothetical protein